MSAQLDSVFDSKPKHTYLPVAVAGRTSDALASTPAADV